MTTVYIFLNEQLDSDGRHEAWTTGYQTWHKMVPAMSWVETELTEHMDILRHSFAECGNAPTGGAVQEQWLALQHRSLSVGDGVKIVPAEGDPIYFVVEKRGWNNVVSWERPHQGQISDINKRALALIPTMENRVSISSTKVNLALTRVKDASGATVTGEYTYLGYTVKGILRYRAYDKYDFEYWVITNTDTGVEVGRTQTLKDAKVWLGGSQIWG